jgi:hypothetical protein
MEENKDGDNEKEVNDTDDVKSGDLKKTIMMKLEKLSAKM